MSDFINQFLGRDGPPKDRRRFPRYPAVTNWAFLARHEGGRICIAPAQLLDLSSVGACALVDERPLEGQATWLRLEEPEPTGWVKANVVRRSGTCQVGLDFAEHCPAPPRLARLR